MFRSADAAGVQKIYLTGYSPAPTDQLGKKRPQFVKVSLGAEDYVPWEKTKDVARLLKKLRNDGYKIYAVEQNKNSVPYTTPSLSPPSHGGEKIALVFGNEVRGLSKSILKKADKILEIPMRGKKESLNVSVAFGIVVFRFVV